MGRRIAAIIRHGDYHQLPGAPSAHQPFALNAEGENHARQGAEIIGNTLASHGWQLDGIIDTSQMLRAWQTARIMADILMQNGEKSLELKSFDELAERSVGSVANLTAAQIQQIIHDDPRYPDLPPHWKSDSEYRLPMQGAESLLQAGERVAVQLSRRMDALKDNQADTLKLFVAHGAAFRHAAYHLGVIEYDQIARLSMYHGQPVFLEHLDDRTWCHIDGEWKVRAIDSSYND